MNIRYQTLAYLEQRTITGLTLRKVVTDSGPHVSDDLTDVIVTTAHTIETGHCHREWVNLLQVQLHHQITWEILSVAQ